ncbi:MAG TPA: zinc ABC transporter substrate-binding protein [Verrucomicrobiales bacterium]|nr:zinc ABC transporter substrate-binding protein [Verrucomicrobiales bacterium]
MNRLLLSSHSPGSRASWGRLLAPIGAALALALSSSSCSEHGPSAPSEGAYRAVATVGMITDIVRHIAGEHAQVLGIIGEGTDPHLYTPTVSDVKLLQSADIVFYNGLLLEGKMTDVLVRVARSGKPVHAVTEAILEQGDYILSGPDDHDDPHVWMDVGGWIRAVPVVAEALSTFDPPHADSYRANAEAYLIELRKLDDYARSAFASIPPERRILVTAHDAFQYMARAYSLEVRGIQGISTESEAGLRDIEDLVAMLVDRRIPAVFVESSVSDKNVRALVEGCQARGHRVRIGGQLFSDAMGRPGTYEGSYIGMIDHNVTTITRALGGNAPERGMQGRLSAITEVSPPQQP